MFSSTGEKEHMYFNHTTSNDEYSIQYNIKKLRISSELGIAKN